MTLYNLNYNVPVEQVAVCPEKVAIGIAIDVAIGQLNASQKGVSCPGESCDGRRKHVN